MEKETLSEKFAALLTGLYAEQQAAAAEKCGVSGGESWRVAFESASNSGARQVCMRKMGSGLYHVGVLAMLLLHWKGQH